MRKIIFSVAVFFAITISAQLQDSKTADDCFKKGDYKCAETEYTLLINKEMFEKFKSKFLNNLGISQRRQSKNAEAFKSFEKALIADPQNIQSYINLSALHAQRGSLQKALDYANKGLILDAENQELYLTRAKIYDDLKKYDLAEKDYLHLTSIAPENLIAKTSFAMFKKNRGRLEDALKDYNKLISEKPESLLYNNRADVYLAMKKYKEANVDIEKALKLDPKFSLSYITKAKILFETGNTTDGCANLDKAIKTGYEKYLISDLLKKCSK